MTLILVWGLLSPPGTPAAERIQRATDEQGTIHIGNAPPVSQEKDGEVKAPAKPVAPEAESPGLKPPSSRRPYGPNAAARRKAILERRQSAPPSPEAPGLANPPVQTESPSSPKSP